MKLESECGVTTISLENAKRLIDLHGPPDRLDFKANKRNVDYRITAHWDVGAVWTFSGFSWGYAGTGPAGLLQFFNMAHVSSLIPDDLPIDKYGKTDCSWFRDPSKVTASI